MRVLKHIPRNRSSKFEGFKPSEGEIEEKVVAGNGSVLGEYIGASLVNDRDVNRLQAVIKVGIMVRNNVMS